jgi:predicted small integral membrane protein
MKTTRGDRFFLGLLATAFTHLAWIGATDGSSWPALGISAVLLGLLGRYA